MRRFQIYESPANSLRVLRSSETAPRIHELSGEDILNYMWKKVGPVKYPSGSIAHPYTPRNGPSHFSVFAWDKPTAFHEIDMFRAQRENLGWPVEHAVMGLGELQYQVFWRDMAQKQYAAQEAMKQGAVAQDTIYIDEDLADKFLLNRALVVNVAQSYMLSGMMPPPKSPCWILLEDVAAMSQWRLLPSEGDFKLAWPLWGLARVAGHEDA